MNTKQKSSNVPTRKEIIQAAADLVPVLRERAESAEDMRKMPDETIQDLKAAGIHKIFTPKRYGGYEMEWGTHVDVARELGKGCASTAWTSSVVMSHTWILGRFPAEEDPQAADLHAGRPAEDAQPANRDQTVLIPVRTPADAHTEEPQRRRSRRICQVDA